MIMMTIDKINDSFCISGIWDGVLHDGTVYFPMNKTAVKIDKKDIVYFMDAWSHDELFATPLRLLQYHGEYLTRDTLHTVFDEIASVKESKKVDENWFRIENLTNEEATFTVPSHGKIAFSAEISIDGETWNMTQFGANSTATIPANGTLFFRNGDLHIKAEYSAIRGLTCDKRHAVSGNMKHICKRVMGTPQFYSVFANDTNLVDLSKLVIPWKKLTDSMFSCAFYQCSNLEKAPSLPATTLATSCYNYTFGGCSSLTSTPELPATTLMFWCYSFMFSGCIRLTQAPELPATTLASSCYNSMFSGCTRLTSAPELPATTLKSWCYNSMFANCSSLSSIKCLATDISAANATTDWVKGVSSSGTFTCASGMSTIWTVGNSGIPTGWEVKDPGKQDSSFFTIANETDSAGTVTLTAAGSPNPVSLKVSSDSGSTWVEYSNLSATTTFALPASGSLMFDGSTNNTWSTDTSNRWTFTADVNHSVSGSLQTLVGPTELSEYEFAELFYDDSLLVDSSKLKLPWTTLSQGCFYAMFSNCTGMTQAPELPATNLSSSCYREMFMNCSSLTKAPELPATILASACYAYMLKGCSSLTSAPALPSTNMVAACYEGLFAYCRSLTQAPELPAKILSYQCYYELFAGCTSLTEAPELPATTLAEGCYDSILKGCTSLVKGPELPATTLVTKCYRNAFYGCRNLKALSCSITDFTQAGAVYHFVTGSSSGTLTCAPGTADTWATLKTSQACLPDGWTIVEAS